METEKSQISTVESLVTFICTVAQIKKRVPGARGQTDAHTLYLVL